MTRLVRTIESRGYPLGGAADRRHAVVCLATVSLAAVLGLGFLVGPRALCGFRSESKQTIARATVFTFAAEAYPAWRADSGPVVCPHSLDALLPFMNDRSNMDPWGTPYRYRCELHGNGSATLRVWSLGEDRIASTEDDVWSGE